MPLQFNPQFPQESSTLGAFAKQLTARANALFEQQAKVGAEVEAQRQILPLKEASDLRLEQAKAQMGQENAATLLQGLQGGGGGGNRYAPGTTAAVDMGGVKLTIPLNRELTAEEAQIVNKAPYIRSEVEKGKLLVQKTGIGTVAMSAIPGVGIASQVFKTRGLARAEALQQVPNNLKVLLGFSLGGKTFSPTEQAAIMRLIDPRAKSDAQATEDLEKSARLAEYVADLVQNGQAATKTWSEVLSEVGISVAEFEERLGLGDEEGAATSPEDDDLASQATYLLQQRRQRR